jgi:hypothetical protein
MAQNGMCVMNSLMMVIARIDGAQAFLLGMMVFLAVGVLLMFSGELQSNEPIMPKAEKATSKLPLDKIVYIVLVGIVISTIVL